jgi:protein-disulfide isomerase
MQNTMLAMSTQNFIGTPSFYINGQLFKKEYNLDGLSKAIDDELTKQEDN